MRVSNNSFLFIFICGDGNIQLTSIWVNPPKRKRKNVYLRFKNKSVIIQFIYQCELFHEAQKMSLDKRWTHLFLRLYNHNNHSIPRSYQFFLRLRNQLHNVN